MRLLNTSTFRLSTYFDDDLPPYAILSHTWGDEEITFQELGSEGVSESLQLVKTQLADGILIQEVSGIKLGFLKIVACAVQAEKDGFEYIWCDTCCIDKTSSAELSENINAMYYFYQDRLCYAYLSDIPSVGQAPSVDLSVEFTKSHWFTRGWTLQELIAPSSVVFFDMSWKIIGRRSDFKSIIAARTGIDEEALNGRHPTLFSVAKRMSWASQRKTTRLEDLAYCLMGIFAVNMPLLYGERHKAFLRLQTEIMRTTEDSSIFAWIAPKDLDTHQCGPLALSPAWFMKSRNFAPIYNIGDEPPFTMTSRGVDISLSMLRVERNVYFANIACGDMTDTRGSLGIYLSPLSGTNRYCRCYPHLLVCTADKLGVTDVPTTKRIYIVQDPRKDEADAINLLYHFHIPELPEQVRNVGLSMEILPNRQIASWNPESRILSSTCGLGAAISIASTSSLDQKHAVLLVGIDFQLRPQCTFDSLSKSLIWDVWSVYGRNDIPGNDGWYHERLLFYDMLRNSTGYSNPLYTAATGPLHDLIRQLNGGREMDWDRWLSETQVDDSASLKASSITSAKQPHPPFNRSTTRFVKHGLSVRMGAYIEKKVIQGQVMMIVCLESTMENAETEEPAIRRYFELAAHSLASSRA